MSSYIDCQPGEWDALNQITPEMQRCIDLIWIVARGEMGPTQAAIEVHTILRQLPLRHATQGPLTTAPRSTSGEGQSETKSVDVVVMRCDGGGR